MLTVATPPQRAARWSLQRGQGPWGRGGLKCFQESSAKVLREGGEEERKREPEEVPLLLLVRDAQ